MGVSKNSGTPKSSILIGFSIINHPFSGTPIFANTHIYWTKNKIFHGWIHYWLVRTTLTLLQPFARHLVGKMTDRLFLLICSDVRLLRFLHPPIEKFKFSGRETVKPPKWWLIPSRERIHGPHRSREVGKIMDSKVPAGNGYVIVPRRVYHAWLIHEATLRDENLKTTTVSRSQNPWSYSFETHGLDTTQ